MALLLALGAFAVPIYLLVQRAFLAAIVTFVALSGLAYLIDKFDGMLEARIFRREVIEEQRGSVSGDTPLQESLRGIIERAKYLSRQELSELANSVRQRWPAVGQFEYPPQIRPKIVDAAEIAEEHGFDWLELRPQAAEAVGYAVQNASAIGPGRSAWARGVLPGAYLAVDLALLGAIAQTYGQDDLGTELKEHWDRVIAE